MHKDPSTQVIITQIKFYSQNISIIPYIYIYF